MHKFDIGDEIVCELEGSSLFISQFEILEILSDQNLVKLETVRDGLWRPGRIVHLNVHYLSQFSLVVPKLPGWKSCRCEVHRLLLFGRCSCGAMEAA